MKFAWLLTGVLGVGGLTWLGLQTFPLEQRVGMSVALSVLALGAMKLKILG